MTPDQTTQPIDLEPRRARAADAKAAVDQIRHAGPADLVAHGLRAALSAADVPGLIAEVEQVRADASLDAAEVKELREDLAELAQAHAVIDATRQMAIDANARLRTQLLEALGREDDGRTPLSGYVAHLVAQRDALKHALGKGVAEEERLRRELDTAWDVAAGNKRHVATLTGILTRVERLTVDDDDDLAPDVAVTVGEIRSAIQAPIKVAGEAAGR